jgi:hypothetical protein
MSRNIISIMVCKVKNQEANQNYPSDEEYFQMVIGVQSEHVKEYQLTVNAVAFDLVMADYKRWVLRTKKHMLEHNRNSFSDCVGSYVLNIGLKKVENEWSEEWNVRIGDCPVCGQSFIIDGFKNWINTVRYRYHNKLSQQTEIISGNEAQIKSLQAQIRELKADIKYRKAKRKGLKQIVRVLEDDARAFIPQPKVAEIVTYKYSKTWYAYALDENGDQIGDAQYGFRKTDAVKALKIELDVE